MKKSGIKIFLLILFTVIATFFTALTLKAGIGTYACWDAVSVNISQLTGWKVAHFCMFMNVFCILLQILMLRREFPPIKLLQLPFVIIFSSLVNFFYYNVLNFELNHYLLRFLLCLISITLVSVFLGLLNALNVISMSVETTCNVANTKFAVDYAFLRIGIDALCTVVSVALSLIFGLTFTIREGTLLALILLGPVEKITMKISAPMVKKLDSL